MATGSGKALLLPIAPSQSPMAVNADRALMERGATPNSLSVGQLTPGGESTAEAGMFCKLLVVAHTAQAANADELRVGL